MLTIRSHQFHNSFSNCFRAFCFLAQYKYRLAKCRSLFLNASGIGQDQD